jgi:hypothetical protein
MGTIIVVHGTGVRLRDYTKTLDKAREVAKAVGITAVIEPCAWGDPLGIRFEGLSLPDPPDPQKLADEELDFASWSWLFADPLFELEKLTIPSQPNDLNAIPTPGREPEWERLWNSVAAYRPSLELQLLLKRGGLEENWQSAWDEVTQESSPAKAAFEASANELPEVCRALARAVIAQLHVRAVASGVAGPSRMLRDSLLDRLIVDWGQRVYGLSDFFVRLFKRAATRALRAHRVGFSDLAAPAGGDVLLYQTHGEAVRNFIREKIQRARPPVTLVAHSLGGIACVDLLALEKPPAVARLVTMGSQAPLLYELGTLFSLKPPQPLPDSFPSWLNFYDRNDFLSYVGHRLWPGRVTDEPVESGQPFPDSHSAYFGNAQVWEKIMRFLPT